MDNNPQTLKFVVAAAVMLGLAGLTNVMTRPTPVEGFGKVGEPFFEDFEDPNQATALRVVAYTEDTASARVFTVENKDGAWRIPSHHNYPADGKDRLANTAKTLIGVDRGALASRVAADHERYGVVNPLDDATDTLKGRGQRITLMKDGEIAVADLIIGKKLPEGQNRYYVRHPDEKETYITELDVDISTKFRDWVEADLLKLDRDNLRKLESRSTEVAGRDISESVNASLTRDSSTDDWKLAGLDEETEEVNKDDVREMVNVIDNLKLSGIRPKPKFGDKPILRGDLSIALPKGAANNPQIVNQVIDMVQSSLQTKGFFVYENREANEFKLYSKAGELVASAKDGVQYHMSFGNEFEGSDEEIEIGGEVAEEEGDEEESEEEQKPADPPGSEEADDEEAEEESDDEGKTKSRYLIVRASFDESLLGPPPVAPVKPDVPEGVEVDDDGNVVKPAEEEKEEEEAAEKTEEESDAADDAAEDGDAEKEKEEETPSVADIYQRAIEKYRADQTKFESDTEDREKQIKEGNEKVEELNSRFADWYYVITGEDFDKLNLSREQMVKLKEKEEAEDGDDSDEAAKDDATDAAPVLTPPAGAPKGEPKSAESTESASESKKPDDTDAAEKPADSAAAESKDSPNAESEDSPAEESSDSKTEKPADEEKADSAAANE